MSINYFHMIATIQPWIEYCQEGRDMLSSLVFLPVYACFTMSIFHDLENELHVVTLWSHGVPPLSGRRHYRYKSHVECCDHVIFWHVGTLLSYGVPPLSGQKHIQFIFNVPLPLNVSHFLSWPTNAHKSCNTLFLCWAWNPMVYHNWVVRDILGNVAVVVALSFYEVTLWSLIFDDTLVLFHPIPFLSMAS